MKDKIYSLPAIGLDRLSTKLSGEIINTRDSEGYYSTGFFLGVGQPPGTAHSASDVQCSIVMEPIHSMLLRTRINFTGKSKSQTSAVRLQSGQKPCYISSSRLAKLGCAVEF